MWTNLIPSSLKCKKKRHNKWQSIKVWLIKSWKTKRVELKRNGKQVVEVKKALDFN